MRKSLHAILAVLFIAVFTSSAFAAATPNVTPSGVVNINTADTNELARLPRVGLKAAQRIVDYRKEHGAFGKTSDLMQVKGFGQKSFDRLSPYLAVNGVSTLNAKVKSTGTRKARKPPTTAAR